MNLAAKAKNVVRRVLVALFPTYMKERAELQFWRARQADENVLRNDHYVKIYTEGFGLTIRDFDGKTILDIGCGPRGSLEWATTAARRVGLDPLANEYLALGADAHQMEYLTSGSERMPLPNASFDYVCSINSLDHVQNLAETVSEIKRVCKPGGCFLLATEVNHAPTVTEPQVFGWDILDSFDDCFTVEFQQRYELETHALWANVRDRRFWQEDRTDKRPGLLLVRLRRKLTHVSASSVA